MVMKEKDEELALFLEMRRRGNDKEKVQGNSDSLDTSLGTFNPRGSSVSNIPPRKTAAERFLDSENDKSDYDWLLTPPRTPSLEMESQKTAMSQNRMANACVTALKSRLINIQEEPASRTNLGSKRITLPSALHSSNCTNRRPSSTSAIRPATPTGRATLPTSTKPSRSSTPTSRATMPSFKPGPVRSSTPTRTVTRSSTPAGRPSIPVLKSAVRSSTPTRQMSTPASAPGFARSSSVTKSASSTLKNPVPPRGNSPAKMSRPMKPYEIPGFSLDAPPNLRTSLPERPASASRGRPGGTHARSSCVETGSKGRPRQQSCSPTRGRAKNSSANGGRISIPSKSRTLSNGSDDVNPVLMGTQMVERVINMRKLAPPKQDDLHSTHNSSCGLDSTGFGRTLSKKSLDMALRHMDIRRSVPGKLRPLTSIPASSVYSVRSGGSTKSKSNSGLDSPLATSSNASSELSVNNSHFFDGIETEVNEYVSQVSEV
ncbi:uncharacterized protein [Euphorbia lathyris]|uniref:uncharacterized protein n=1 Tax=Euphorbia lathyris TaxID=212925 RepID=UPI0033133615